MREEQDYMQACGRFLNDPYVTIEPWSDRINHLRIIILGKKGTPYEGGRFIFEVFLTSYYPAEYPFVYCHTMIWHPNINLILKPPKSNICFPRINSQITEVEEGQETPVRVYETWDIKGWTSACYLMHLVEAIKNLIHLVKSYWNPIDGLNSEAVEQATNAPEKFKKQAKEWTKKYAMEN